jgi:hypothetical protein
MARRRAYSAYRPGSAEQQIKVELTAAVSSLRKGKVGCAKARKHAEKAVAILHGASKALPNRTLFRQAMRIGRIGLIHQRKCGR